MTPNRQKRFSPLQLDVLQFIHLNEYVHADITAEHIYIRQGEKTQVGSILKGHDGGSEAVLHRALAACVCGQVYLVGYGHAFRYCPGGQRVEYREASRSPHEGTIEYISLDSHKGAGEALFLYCPLLVEGGTCSPPPPVLVHMKTGQIYFSLWS